MSSILENGFFVTVGVILLILFGVLILISRFYKKVAQGQALVRTGVGGTKISFNGIIVIPIIHKLEIMDISLKTVEIARMEKDGLICKDNVRADIKVTFFVRVNELAEDVQKVAQTVGCKRASSRDAMIQLFDAKFSEALKTVGKRFEFVDLYNKRDEFREEIVNIIGTDLNGYILDDAAIDYLEQTSLKFLNTDNILDAEGIKKITELTANQNVKANLIRRDEEKIIKKQNVDAREAILELDKQLAEKEEKQKREIANIKAREQAEIDKVKEEELKKSERARIEREEEIMVAEENKLRQIIVASKNKEKTEAIETERVTKERDLEITERERIVTLAQIEKEKSIEIEKKNIQEVIRERVAIEKTVVDEEERINDTRAFAEAERLKKVAIVNAEKLAEEQLVQEIKAAEASKQAAEFKAQQKLIDADAEQKSSVQKADAIKTLAEAKASEFAATGIAEAQVMEAKASAIEKQGDAEAHIIEVKAEAEAKGIELKGEANAQTELKLGIAKVDIEKKHGLVEAEIIEAKAMSHEKKGLAEAKVDAEKYRAEADGILQKAEAMKKLDGVGKEHEEFKLRLDKDKEIELAQISIQKDIADAQADVISEALKSANIDIVGGEQEFFDRITGSITKGKALERTISSSDTLSKVKSQLLDNVEGETFIDKLKTLISNANLKSEDVKNLTISALLAKVMAKTSDAKQKGLIEHVMYLLKEFGLDNLSTDNLDM